MSFQAEIAFELFPEVEQNVSKSVKMLVPNFDTVPNLETVSWMLVSSADDDTLAHCRQATQYMHYRYTIIRYTI